MADDRKKFSNAVKWRSRLLQDRDVSVPAEEGKVAILCWHPVGEYACEKANKSERKEARIFRKEALALLEIYAEIGKEVEIVYRPSSNDMQTVIQDPKFSDIITIGHGCLSSFFLETGTANSLAEYDWYDAISDAEHLKTGMFMQRHCGHYARDLNVPIGTFITTSPEGVIAPAGYYFSPKGLYHAASQLLIQPIIDLPLEYAVFKQQFPTQDLPPKF